MIYIFFHIDTFLIYIFHILSLSITAWRCWSIQQIECCYRNYKDVITMSIDVYLYENQNSECLVVCNVLLYKCSAPIKISFID